MSSSEASTLMASCSASLCRRLGGGACSGATSSSEEEFSIEDSCLDLLLRLRPFPESLRGRFWHI